LVELLVKEGAQVTALACYNSFDAYGWLDDLPGAVRDALVLLRGDVRDPAFMQSVMQGQDTVFHLAALIAIPHSYVAAQSYVETNVLGTLNVLEAARDFGVRRVIHTSTSEVYGSALTMPITEDHRLQGQSPYSASKIGADMMAEAFTRSFELPVAILRPFNTFGPRQSERAVIPSILRQMLDPACGTIEVGDTSTVRDFTFVRDTARAFLALGMAPAVNFGQPYNAGSGSAVSVGELLELATELTGCSKPIHRAPARMRPDKSEVRALLADSSRLTANTGWRPATSLREGLSHTIAWWRDRLGRNMVRKNTDFMT